MSNRRMQRRRRARNLLTPTRKFRTNRAKLRGWKRYERKIRLWKAAQLTLNIPRLESYCLDYVDIRLTPLYHRLTRRQTLVKYSRLFLGALSEIYDAWHDQLVDRGKPFYLVLRIFPCVMDSEVMVCIDEERVQWYKTRYPTLTNATPPFDQYHSDEFDMRAFHWVGYQRDEYLDDEPENEFFRRLYRGDPDGPGYWYCCVGEDGNRELRVVSGEVWVGSKYPPDALHLN